MEQKTVDTEKAVYRKMFPQKKSSTKNTRPTKKDFALYRESKPARKQNTGNVSEVVVNGEHIRPRHFSPYQCTAYSEDGVVWHCEACLLAFPKNRALALHRKTCRRDPPGDEIYRTGNLSVFRVDGRIAPRYCRSLCLLGKLFIDHKTLYYDVTTFLFYVLKTAGDGPSPCIAGYFSRERTSETNNLSCLVVLPTHQNKGYGFFLISLSYLLTRVGGAVGSPERPLSESGRGGYVSYWTWTVLLYLRGMEERGERSFTLQRLSKETGMTKDDIVTALDALGLVRKKKDARGYSLSSDWKQKYKTKNTKQRLCAQKELLKLYR
ncbi:MAG: MYST histone acetyltransferase [Amphiamblys sp. WSBS2006]|nr:MAG: MYST histone acetyltransferase [Amphiamblys sp. WSBS2006]